ncbi:MAG: MerR family transcriptional regulator [Candidatus Omnitrophica bacterium]|nr:MerR family transcriptional regulator [Candidatus Omnitrophota bacterium]MCF7892359.1 MerR family transcriptional regulator [Candidatus Omnitrophota bacterium]MCF7895619.1 MerR family transcriptional regulator [Candidatus Omnitrophota bacterium]MCF7897312.1 MerR family transcriptional regulator [Candidatus Omnitrophota bacterium]MCF7909347.1 MerR family transcriptional regulator [Candidatus Omnitrophota bacterium]
MEESYKEPVYQIGIAAKLIEVCPATLRIWEKKNLIKPTRLGKNRFYSKCDLDRLRRIKKLIQKEGLNIEGAKKVLGQDLCWQIKKCPPQERDKCSVYKQEKKKKE